MTVNLAVAFAAGFAFALFVVLNLWAVASPGEWSWPTLWAAAQATAGFLAFAAAFWVGATALRQVRETESQLAVTQGQWMTMQEDLEDSRRVRHQENKPLVVLDYRHHPERGTDNAVWVFCNIGRGVAVNVSLVSSPSGRLTSLGGLPAGAERPVPSAVTAVLGSADSKWPPRNRHLVIAEGSPTRTRRWNPTMNLQRTDGSFVHTTTYPQGPNDNGWFADAEDQQGISDYLTEHQSLLFEQFAEES